MADLPDVYTPTKRKNMTAKRRLKVFLESEGRCCLCGATIDGVREKWIVEHLTPLADGGLDEEANMAPAHEKCAKSKTSGEAKTRKRHRRASQNHFGAKEKKASGRTKTDPTKS